MFEVRAFDGEAEGLGAFPAVVPAVRNTPPVPPRVSLDPTSPTAATGLACRVSVPPADPDGDELTLRFYWTRDGQPAALAPAKDRLLPGELRRGEKWSCRGAAHDGETEVVGEATAAAEVKNAAPTTARLAVIPATPSTADELQCALAEEPGDADGDRVTMKYTWEKNGKKARDGAIVPAGDTTKGDRWTCRAVPSDGKADGPPADAEATVANSSPERPEVRIRPEPAVAGEDLRCEVIRASKDADGDGASYSFMWFKGGAAQGFAPTSASVPARLVKAGDAWQCEVTPTDGVAAGPSARSDEVRVPPAAGR